MLGAAYCEQLAQCVDRYWADQLANEAFSGSVYEKATGKEGGHQLADLVDELTSSYLRVQWPADTGFQHRKGKQSPRSMGDIWVRNGAREWHPVNIKTGLVGSEGQPNLVSLKKLMRGILDHQIDAYYLLFVKFAVDRQARKVHTEVHLVDLLEWVVLDRQLFAFDSGPGQLMLRAKAFFEALKRGVQPPRDGYAIGDKLSVLFKIYQDGERRLRENRERDLKQFVQEYEAFGQATKPFTLSLEAQAELEIR